MKIACQRGAVWTALAVIAGAVLMGHGTAAAAQAQDDARGQRLFARFRQLDRNSDGALTKDELPNAPWVTRADGNGDGTVTLEEAAAAFGFSVPKNDAGGVANAPAPGTDPSATNGGLVRREWQIDGVTREGLVYAPASAKTSDAPLVFVFHGHGGTMRIAAQKYHVHTLWPEAIVVYLQGLPTPGMTDPEGKRAGWQKTEGDQNDRDLKLFDAVLSSLKQDYKVDTKRVYVTGHSNGGGFTYLLWAARGDAIAAVAPSAAGAARNLARLKPMPAMHIAGEQDEVVPYAFQVRTMNAVRGINGCDDTGSPWAAVGKLAGTIYPSKTGTPFVSVIFPGSHTFPEEALPLVVRFFKENAKP